MKHKIFLSGLLVFLTLSIQAQISRSEGKSNVAYHAAYQRMAAGSDHYLEIKNGELFAAGSNSDAQLGDGTTNSRNTAAKVGTDDNWVTITAGTGFSLGIKADGTLWAWGKNDLGQLGIGTNVVTQTPVQVGSDRWISVSAGSDFTLAVREDGTLWAWGGNSMGQLGRGTNNFSANATPVQIGTATNWTKIAAGFWHSLALKADGTLWSWGANAVGQLGNGSVSVTGIATPVQIGTDNKWKQLAAGGFFSAALQSDGTLWVWGDNYYGQVSGSSAEYETAPYQVGSERWNKVVAGRNHILALKANGKVWSWGDEQGNGIQTNNTPVEKNISGIVQIAAGNSFSFALKSNGELFSWGKNNLGQLGNGSNQNAVSPLSNGSKSEEIISVAAAHGFNTLVLYSNGKLKGWGANNTYQLANEQTVDFYEPIAISAAGGDNIAIVTGIDHTLVLKEDGTLWGWGDGEMIGNSTNSQTPVQIGTSDEWISMTTGSFTSAGIKSDGTLWTWGYNSNGQLGNGSTNSSPVPVKVGDDNDWVAVAMGGSHTAAVKSDGSLWGWGRNYSAEAGAGEDTEDVLLPLRIGTDNDWVGVTSASFSTLALKADGTLWGWGAANMGQIGGPQPFPIKVLAPQKVSEDRFIQARLANWSGSAIRTDGKLMGWTNFNMVFGDLGMGNNNNYPVPTLVPGQENIVQISAGQAHRSLLKAQRKDVCMAGRNFNGELGITDETTTTLNTYQCGIAPFGEEEPVVVIESVTIQVLNGASPVVYANNTLQLVATVMPVAVNQEVVWSISNGSEFAGIDSNGLITGLAEGIVTIRATSVENSAIYGEIQIEVKEETASVGKFDLLAATVYPNPSTGNITVKSEYGIVKVEMFDMSGKRVADFTTAAFDISHLPAGVYQTRVELDNGKETFIKIVKK
ncbi:T9SS type A sorting domain-containing protein [Myroides ceti]|uniref:T9SS type A sorting domain-containing protein n=1 Tax=Paenimyroides ceti TaxID=395087 RepID=A0ABT8CNE2_9FLAO|nr:T9SS type A sorting domain-containing protein [Paenimyroides ceti]MDN3705705.1 T9SS type A sorting domain-containing protein [Paenimyroides ceti]